jgi:hypothetical protein
VKARLAALFKTSTDKISALLNRPGIVIKKDIDLATAKKYAGAIQATGALCRIDPPEAPAAVAPVVSHLETPAPSATVAPATADDGRAEPRVVVITFSQKPEDRFAPKTIEKISGAEGGIRFQPWDGDIVSFQNIVALSAFSEVNGPAETIRLFVFIHAYERPVVCDIDKIVFSDFPIKVFPKNIASFRGFLHFLCKTNPSIIIEETTLDFLSGSPPQQLDAVKAAKLATGMGQLIASGDIDAQT